MASKSKEEKREEEKKRALSEKQKKAIKQVALILLIAFGGAVGEKYAGIASQIIEIALSFL
jgi:hypothetical protein